MFWVFEVHVKLVADTETQHSNGWRNQEVMSGLKVQFVLVASLVGGHCELGGWFVLQLPCTAFI